MEIVYRTNRFFIIFTVIRKIELKAYVMHTHTLHVRLEIRIVLQP